MRTSLISIITFFASAGLIKAAPTYLGLADDFDPGSPPTHNSGADDLHGHPKVVAIATRFNAGTKEVLLTRAQGSKKGLELIRGKMKAGETSYEGANREAYEETGVHGEPNTNEIHHSYWDKDGNEQHLVGHIVKIPLSQQFAHNNERRIRHWVDHDKVLEHIRRPEQRDLYEKALQHMRK